VASRIRLRQARAGGITVSFTTPASAKVARVRLFKRGAAVGTGTLILPRKTLRTRNRVGAGLKGHVAEVVLYNRSLSELERLGVESYLNDRYFPAPPVEKR